MKKIALICIFLLVGCSINTQEDNAWTAFWDDDSGLMGFKDHNGEIEIEPKYTGFTTAKKFDKIVAVVEEKNGKYEAYYLTKSGKKVGEDALYLFDNAPDCECEGFIRFRDKKTDKAGMFNGKGEITIPADYDDLTNARNGMVAALKGGKKKCLSGNNPSGCEHFTWIEGKEYLIDINNKIIIENFKNSFHLNFFSLKVGNEPARDVTRQDFRGVDGKYYSFTDYEKEFRVWLYSSFLSQLTREKLIESSYHKIYFWKEPEGWISEGSTQFINRNFRLIGERLTEIKRKNSDYFISIDGLNPFIYEGLEFADYFNNCGEPKEWKYPVMTIVINHNAKNDSYQDQFEFLKTENGYRLIGITIRNGTLK